MKLIEGFKETEIGFIPETWDVAKLSEIVSNRSEKYTPSRDKNIPYIALEHIDQETGRLLAIGDSSKTTSTKSVFYRNDILFGKLRPYLRKYWLSNIDGVCSTEILSLKSTENHLFAFYLIQTNKFIEDISKKAFGTKMPRTSWNDIKDYKFALPPLLEKQRISEILSSIDEHIEKLDKILEDYQLLKKGMMKKLLTEGIGHAEFKETNIGRIPKDWEVKRLSEVCKNISIGLVTTMTKNYEVEGVPLIRNSDIKEGKVVKDRLIFLNNEFSNKNINRCLLEGDVVTVHTGDIGTSAVIDKGLNGCHGFATINSRVNKEIVNEFYYSDFLNSEVFKKQAYSVSTGDGRNNLNLKDFVNMLITLPKDINEQVEITRNLIYIRDRLNLYNQERGDFLQLKKALMEQILTGKVRVNK